MVLRMHRVAPQLKGYRVDKRWDGSMAEARPLSRHQHAHTLGGALMGLTATRRSFLIHSVDIEDFGGMSIKDYKWNNIT